MAEISRNCKDNYLLVYKGFHKSNFIDDQEKIPLDDSGIEILKDRKKVTGIKFNQYFEKLELASYYAENDIKKKLEANKYYNLFLGNNFETKEINKEFHLKIDNDRPDFLVNIPFTGNIMIDVKCRRIFEVQSESNDVKYVNLNIDEINSLSEIEERFNMQVWLVIKDYFKFDFNKNYFKETEFYLSPVSVIKEYLSQLNLYCKKINKLLYTYKVPVSIFTKSNSFQDIAYNLKANKELLIEMAGYTHKTMIRLRKVISDVVKNERMYKSYIAYQLCSNSEIKDKYCNDTDFFTPQDINSILWDMIDKNEIVHINGEYLKVKE